jgi:hypothetical protein
MFVNREPYLVNRSTTIPALKLIVDKCTVHSISAFVSVTMGLEIRISRRQTVTEAGACAECSSCPAFF